MLTLEPALPGTERAALFADHANPSCFYYQPLVPRLAYQGKAPQLHLIEWRGQAGEAGLLNLTVNLRLDQDELQGIAEGLRQRYDLPTLPQLAPIPLVDGTVKLMMLGSESGGDTGGPFTLTINQAARPALFGNNQAVFSVELGDADSVSMVQRTLEEPEGKMLPIGIIYSLRFLAMRPSYAFTLSADWDAVQKRLYERFGLNLVFLQIAIENEVDDLIAQGAITIKDQVSGSEQVRDRDRMVAEIKSAVLSTFFEPAVLPPTGARDGRMPLGFSRTRADATYRLSRTIGASVTELVAVERTLSPAAYLAELTPTGQAAALISPLDPGNQDAVRTVNVSSQGDFARDGISSINISLQYGSDADNKTQVILRRPDDQQTVSWKPIVSGGEMERDVDVLYDVFFDTNHSLRPPASLSAPPTTTTLDNLVIVPRDLYRVVAVPITTLDSLWKDYREVGLAVEYDDAGVPRQAGFTLTPGKRNWIWTVLVRDMGQLHFSYRTTWTFGDLAPFTTAPKEGTGEQILLRDPFPGRRALDIVPDFDWSRVQKVVARVEYRNPDRTINLLRIFDFSPGGHEPRTLLLPEIGSVETPVLYTIWVTFADGTSTNFPPSYTEEAETTITLNACLPRSRIVLVRPQEIDFVGQHLAQLQVDVRYVDAANALHESATFTFDTADATGLFAFTYADPDSGKYQYRVTYQPTNGRRESTDWQEWPDGDRSADWVIRSPPFLSDTAYT